MSIVDRTLARWGYVKAGRGSLPDVATITPNYGGQSSSQSYASVYEKLSWVQIAITTVARSASAAQLNVEQRGGDGSSAIANHPFEMRILSPAPHTSRSELLFAHYASLLLTGNSYIWLNRASESVPPDEMYHIPSGRICPVPDGKMGVRGYLYDPGNGQDQPREAWEIVHTKLWHPEDRYVGLSPLQAVMYGAQADIAAQRYGARFYGEDNAKIAGALAYADPIDDTTWERMKLDMRAQHGSGKSRMMLLRNVGKGGVEWIRMGLTQQELQYLEARQFTKEEIFALYAPGLASMLAINANEANAKSGAATLNERAVYPLLKLTAERLTINPLPSYGPNLVVVPEDVRGRDRALELSEYDRAKDVLTIDELRERYFSLPPREQGQQSEQGQDAKGILAYHIEQGVVSRNEARAALGLAPEDETQADRLRQLSAQLAVLKLATDAGLPLEAATSLVGIEVALPEPKPTEPPPRGPMTTPADSQTIAFDPLAQDMAKWQRKALKRLAEGKAPAVAFASAAIPPLLAGAIDAALAEAVDADDVAQAFKLAPTDLTPDELDLYRRLVAILERSGSLTARQILRGEPVAFTVLDAQVKAALLGALTDAALARAQALAAVIGPDFDPADLDVGAWAASYSAERAEQVTATTRGIVERVINQARATPGMPLADVARQLGPAFSARRAETIAVTEITRAASQATLHYQRYLKTHGLEFERIWQTNNDEHTCAICTPLNGKPERIWGQQFPDGAPAHARCRCATSLRRVRP